MGRKSQAGQTALPSRALLSGRSEVSSGWSVSHCFCCHGQRVSPCYAAKPALPAVLGAAGNPRKKKEILNW